MEFLKSKKAKLRAQLSASDIEKARFLTSFFVGNRAKNCLDLEPEPDRNRNKSEPEPQ
jgi:hypothetical protein